MKEQQSIMSEVTGQDKKGKAPLKPYSALKPYGLLYS
jgi:hypothetical protein